MKISHIIDDSYRSAVRALVMGTSPVALARARERAFYRSLVAELQETFSSDDIRVFSAYGRRNFREFGAEKLLSDIAVGRVGKIDASDSEAQGFHFVAGLVWQIEVNFSRESTPAIYAINRLNCGSADNKLLLGAHLARGNDKFLEALRVPFAAGAGAAHIALIPHPAEWDESNEAPVVWQLKNGKWVDAN